MKENSTEAKKRIDGDDNSESPANVSSTTPESVTDPEPCHCTCPPPPAYEILITTAATTINDVSTTEKHESAEISTKSFREDHLSRKGTSFCRSRAFGLDLE